MQRVGAEIGRQPRERRAMRQSCARERGERGERTDGYGVTAMAMTERATAKEKECRMAGRALLHFARAHSNLAGRYGNAVGAALGTHCDCVLAGIYGNAIGSVLVTHFTSWEWFGNGLGTIWD